MKYELYFASFNIKLILDTEIPLSVGEEISFGKTEVFAPNALKNSHHYALQLVGKTFRVLRISRIISEIDNSRINSDKNRVQVLLK